MSEPRWTPGPWQAVKSFDPDFSFAICAQPHPALRGFTHIIAGIREADDAEANARLTAAAPDLIDVVKRGRQNLSTYVAVYPGDKELRGLLNDWDAAIAKATGCAS